MNFCDKHGKQKPDFPPFCTVGALNSVKTFVEFIENQILQKVKKIILGEKEINFKEDRSFASLGIKENINCKIIFRNKLNI